MTRHYSGVSLGIVRWPKYLASMSNEMREPTYLLLTALLDGPKHGYGMISSVKELSNGRVTLRVGTLYGALERLAIEGLVRESGSEVVAGRHRRYYAITDDGVAAVEAETAQILARAKRARTMLAARREGFAS